VVIPVSGMSWVTPPTITKTCRAITEREAAGQQLGERVPHRDRGPQAPLHDEAVDQQEGHQAGEAEFLAEGR